MKKLALAAYTIVLLCAAITQILAWSGITPSILANQLAVVTQITISLPLAILATLPLICGGYFIGRRHAGTSSLTIVKAEYGCGAVWRDVTDRIIKAVEHDRVMMDVTNANLGVDSCPNKPKELKVQYKSNWFKNQKTVKEGFRLELP